MPPILAEWGCPLHCQRTAQNRYFYQVVLKSNVATTVCYFYPHQFLQNDDKFAMGWQIVIYFSSLILVSSRLELVSSFSQHPFKATTCQSTNTIIYQGRKIKIHHSYDGINEDHDDNYGNTAEQKSLSTKYSNMLAVHLSARSNLALLKRRQLVAQSFFFMASLSSLTQFGEDAMATTAKRDDGCSNGSLAAGEIQIKMCLGHFQKLNLLLIVTVL